MHVPILVLCTRILTQASLLSISLHTPSSVVVVAFPNLSMPSQSLRTSLSQIPTADQVLTSPP